MRLRMLVFYAWIGLNPEGVEEMVEALSLDPVPESTEPFAAWKPLMSDDRETAESYRGIVDQWARRRGLTHLELRTFRDASVFRQQHSPACPMCQQVLQDDDAA